nr:hypothetical protein [Salinicola tamaricis]
MSYHFNFAPILAQWPLLLSGIGLGLLLALVSIAIGSLLGLAVAFATRAPSRWLATSPSPGSRSCAICRFW